MDYVIPHVSFFLYFVYTQCKLFILDLYFHITYNNCMSGQYLSIQTCAKKYNLNPATLRRWIKKGFISAQLEDNQYLIDEDSLVEYLNSKGIEAVPQLTDNIALQLAKLERELELANRFIEQLQKENEFLRGQVQQLTNTINILTTKALEAPTPMSFRQRIRRFFGLERE